MSVVNYREVKVQLPRSGPDVIWDTLLAEFPQGSRRRLRYLGMLALHEVGGWTLDDIGHLFKHNKGHVSRCLARVKELIRQEFEIEPERRPCEERQRRYLAMLGLHDLGWSVSEIGELFHHNKGHISRCLRQARLWLTESLAPTCRQCHRRRYFAMLALHEIEGWSVEEIGELFHHNKGHVSRCLRRARQWRNEVKGANA